MTKYWLVASLWKAWNYCKENLLIGNFTKCGWLLVQNWCMSRKTPLIIKSWNHKNCLQTSSMLLKKLKSPEKAPIFEFK
jgi:hypothetical protein